MKKPEKRILLSYPHMCGAEEKFVAEAFRSNWIAPLGPQVDAFEKETAEYCGVKGALALSSGSAAIHLGLKLLGVGAGDVVFCSSLTFIASVAPVLYLGATPVFIDSDEESWNMSPQALQRAFEDAGNSGSAPRAVVVAELYGGCPQMDEIRAVCARYGAPVLEDAAEALGSEWRGKKCGSLTELGVLSYNGNKIITTSGGGMLLSDDAEALARARFWATQAREPAPWYEHRETGYNYRLSNLLAAVGRGQMTCLEERIARRSAIFERYRSGLADTPQISFMPEPEGSFSNRWLTTVIIDPASGGSFMDVINYLDDRNVESRPVWKPMHLQPLFRENKYFAHGGESVSDRLFNNGVCLPSCSAMSDLEQDWVIECLKEAVRG